MRYTLGRDDMPLLLQWIKKFDKLKLVEFFGGAGGTRTLDLCVANAPLSQLSYNPIRNILYYSRVKAFCQVIFKILSAKLFLFSFPLISETICYNLTFLLNRVILIMYRNFKKEKLNMKKIFTVLLILSMLLSLYGCALAEMFSSDDNVVDLGGGETAVKWHLVSNTNEYSTVESAYFEFTKDSFKYYENGSLKKEGTHRTTYSGVENTISPLTVVLYFDKDETGFSVYDYLECYTEDERDDLHQFTVMSEGYHIKPLRSGGVPVRDYHLSDMPYAFGTYVKEDTEQYTYKNGKANYLSCSYLDGTFTDEKGNSFYFANNSYSSDPENVSYSIYMRYENRLNGTFVEGTIKMSYYEDLDTGKKHNVALIYVSHGENEPAEETGVSVEADFKLMDLDFGDDTFFSIAGGEYFTDTPECEFDPADFISGTYRKVTTSQ